jgi:polyisoprenoid-binding protein YceI
MPQKPRFCRTFLEQPCYCLKFSIFNQTTLNKMFSRILNFAAIAAICLMAACAQAPVADKAQTGEAQQAPAAATSGDKMAVDVAASTIAWIGTKPVGQHNGMFKLKSGELALNGGQLSGGKFVIDMNSLQVLDGDADTQAKLGGHLKAADFFETEKHPEATFEITGVQPYTAPADLAQKVLLQGATHTIAGNLTMKGVTKSVTFPAIVKATPEALVAQANFNINRTDWGLVYGNDQSLGDKFIRPEVNIALNIAAKK